MASSTWSAMVLGRAVLAGLLLTACAGPAMAANFDGTKVIICAVSTIMECDAGKCDRYAPPDTPAGAPAFFKIDVPGKLVTASAGRKSPIAGSSQINGRLVIQGGENGRGWSATIDEDSGVMSAAVVDEDFTFSLFGACTVP